MSSLTESVGFLKYMLRILKSFVIFFLCTSFLFGAFKSIYLKSFYGLVDGLTFGFLVTMATLPILTFLDAAHKIKCFFKYKKIDFSVNQERRFAVEDTYHNVIKKICGILNSLKIIDAYEKDENEGVIEAVTKRSLRSFREIIVFKIFKSSSGLIVIALESKPKVWATLVDYSKNFENIEKIYESMRHEFSNLVVVAR